MRMEGTPKRNNDTVSGVFGLLSVNGNSNCSSPCPTPCIHSHDWIAIYVQQPYFVWLRLWPWLQGAGFPVHLKYGKEPILNDVVKKARYTRCKTKGNAESRIILVGG